MCGLLPILTKSIDILCSRCETHWSIWSGPGSAYQPLPYHQSGLTAVLLHYYQSLPAAVLNTHTMISGILFYILIVGLLAYAAYLKNTMWRK
jgi:hypothetical protein